MDFAIFNTPCVVQKTGYCLFRIPIALLYSCSYFMYGMHAYYCIFVIGLHDLIM